MKIMTLNTHSLVERDYEKKLLAFTEGVLKEAPDIIALQEVNQSISADVITPSEGYKSCCDAVIRSDNHVYNAVRLLSERGLSYYWTWLPLKRGYMIYNEGIAILSRTPFDETRIIEVSLVQDYENWKTRKLLGIKTLGQWFYSVHYGWWEDEDSFSEQFGRTENSLNKNEKIWLMGDFNNPAEIRGEGYDLMTALGWYDCYNEAAEKDEGKTAEGKIDGWREREKAIDRMRLDQIWCSKPIKPKSCYTVFNGRRYPVVSDHFGVIAEI